MVMGDIEPFKSPVDGTIITGRAALRAHFKQHNVTYTSDYDSPGGYWEKKRAEREKFYTPGAGADRERRIQHLIRAYDKHRR